MSATVRMAGLCDDLAAETAAVRALVAPLSEDGWRRATPAPGWTIADQLVHLADVDELAVLAATGPGSFRAGPDGPHRGIDERVAAHRHRSGAEVLGWFDAARAHLITVFTGTDPRARLPWFGPPMSAASAVTARIMETWAHGLDVADALGAAPVVSERLRHVAHLGVAARPYSLRDTGVADPGADVRVELAAPDGGTWAWGGTGATDRVRASALDFCLLVTRRRHPDDLDLDVDGPLARRWVGVAQAFAGPPGQGRAPREERPVRR
ncbi:TIGR03084 family metal-binding protein [Pseudonocardia nematodicida]|uniref:TIGR03084 family metal-binding protein n=1 Tax=Pseudonocardia nematodicida TaxID=1206997 RepID=A0ABV1K697_9PSEU